MCTTLLKGEEEGMGEGEGKREGRTVADLPHKGLDDLVFTCLVEGVGALRVKNFGVGWEGREGGREGGREECD